MLPRLVRIGYLEVLHTEQMSWVRPHLFDGKARSCRQLCKLLERIFVRTLRPDAFAQFEVNLTLPNANRLVFQTHQMHLDPTLTGIVESIVSKLVQLEVGIQFLVHAHQQVLIELSRHPLRIIIGPVQDVEVLLQIHPDQQAAPLAYLRNLLQKAFVWLTIKVADARSPQQATPPPNSLFSHA